MRLPNWFGIWIVILVWVFAVPAHAEEKSPPLSCLNGLGDLWGDEKPGVRIRDIDGNLIRDIAAFQRAVGTRERGLKKINGGDFSGWNFAGVPLHQVCFVESNLQGANMQGVTGTGAGFVKSDLTGANLQGAIMPYILFRDAKLARVNATGAVFSSGHFDGGWFEGNVAGWTLDRANMQGFVFDCGITLDDGCPVYRGEDPISAKKTDFTGAILHSFGLFGALMDGAVLANTVIGPAQLPELVEADFRDDLILRGGSNDIKITSAEAMALLADHRKRLQSETRPSFDCANAVQKIAVMICGEYASDLRAMDRDVAALYKQVRKTDSGVRSSQRAWLKKRNSCMDREYPSDCVRQSYSQRKGQLLAMLGERQWLQPGQEAYFADEILPLTKDLKETEFYQKIAPALIGGSRSEVLIKRGKNGLYTINGWSVGANAHTCSVSASTLYLDKASGWYIVVSEEENPAPVFRIFQDRLEIFANGRPDYDKYPNAANFLSCGMRASFGEMIRMNLDDPAMAKVRASFVGEY